ncbi:MAG: IS1182 family transposase [Candidatus Xenobia bacterium]
MLQHKGMQLSFIEAEAWCSHLIDEKSFYAKLHDHGESWFRDDDFADMYARRGRPSVPPSLLVRALALQNHDNISDRELVNRVRFDLRYKYALNVPIDYEGFDPSLLTVFRSRLLLHEKGKQLLELSLLRARESGVLSEEDKQAVDSMPILGAAAVQDTWTLLRSGIRKVLAAIERAGGTLENFPMEKYQQQPGKPDIDWNDEAAKMHYLAELVSDATGLLTAVEKSDLRHDEQVRRAGELLSSLVDQDVEAGKHFGAPCIKTGKGATKNRVISTNDPEMRHGHKTSHNLFEGYKGHFMVSLQGELVTAVEVTPANIHDAEPLPSMLDVLKGLKLFPSALFADCAYGGGDTRVEVAARSVELMARVPKSPITGFYPKEAFTLDLEALTATCPAGNTTSKVGTATDEKGRKVRVFEFSAALCANCPLRSECTSSAAGGRKVRANFHEEILQQARERAAKPGFRQEMKQRLVVERVQSHLKRMGLRVTRYFGARKVRLQATLTAFAYNFQKVTTAIQGGVKQTA